MTLLYLLVCVKAHYTALMVDTSVREYFKSAKVDWGATIVTVQPLHAERPTDVMWSPCLFELWVQNASWLL